MKTWTHARSAEPSLVVVEVATYPEPLVDLKHAIKWIRTHGTEYGANPDFLVVTGGSAGGHLSSLVALTANDPEYQEGFEHIDTQMHAAVPFYGPAPDPAEAARVQAAMLIVLAGLDARVNGTAHPWAEALRAAGKDVTVHEFPGVDHAFHNDTSAARYNREAAEVAWAETLAFFRRHLRG